MASFRSVNLPRAEGASNDMAITPPNLPASNDAPQQPRPQPPQPPNPGAADAPALDEAATPTRATFQAAGMTTQRPLPPSPPSRVLPSQRPSSATSPFPSLAQPSTPSKPKRKSSQRSKMSTKSMDSDVDMDASDSGDRPSSNDSRDADGSAKRKKSAAKKEFPCDWPGCPQKFTRSEHLARHVSPPCRVCANVSLRSRKHTGERPFPCHCGRQFSRLDNLRQHAQTVHQNETIPPDSLAATTSRYQRQIRTDSVRQAPRRPRAGTGGSVGPAGRGHRKSLSSPNVNAVFANLSTNDSRRRPAPIVLRGDDRARYSLESISGLADGYTHGASSPGDYNTPTSTTFSTGPDSPGWASAVQSPAATHSRSQSLYTFEGGTPDRRLSVPSSMMPFPFGPERNGQYPSFPASPTTPTSSTWSRRESVSSHTDDYRRRTWHPDTYALAGASRLSQITNTSQLGWTSPVPPPLAKPDPQRQQNSTRLPGIEAFGPFLPPRRPSMTMEAGFDDTRPHVSVVANMLDERRPGWPEPRHERIERDSLERERYSQHEIDLPSRGMANLDINTPPRDGSSAWAREANRAVLAQADNFGAGRAPPPWLAPPTGSRHQHTVSAPIGRSNSERIPAERRRAWHGGPIAINHAPETIHEGRPHVERITHPNMHEFQGFPARTDPPVVHQSFASATERGHPGLSRDGTRAFDALVAVATATNESTATIGLSEGSRATPPPRKEHGLSSQPADQVRWPVENGWVRRW